MKGLNSAIVKKLKILLPPIEEQNRITETLSCIKNKLKLENQQKIELERVKLGLMQILLSGRVRVRLDEGGLHRVRDG